MSENRGNVGGNDDDASSSSSFNISLSGEDILGGSTCVDEKESAKDLEAQTETLERPSSAGAAKEGGGRGGARDGPAKPEPTTLSRYAAWYRANESWIAPFEQALQSAIWFLPDSGSEVGTELLHSLASLWTVGNEQVMLLTEEDKEMERLRNVEKRFPQALLPLVVATVEQFETVAECLLMQKERETATTTTTTGATSGGGQRYKWLCVIEAFKAAVRLGQLYKSRGSACVLLDGGTSGVGRAVDASATGAERRQLEAFQIFRAKYLVHHPKAAPAPSPAPPAGGSEKPWVLDLTWSEAEILTLAEMVHCLRPVAYCALLWRHGPKSWRPWCLSLLLEVAALTATPRVTRRRQCLRLNPLVRRETEARWARLVLYLARSPFYDNFTRGRLASVRSGLRRVPLLGMAADAGYNLLDEIQEYYTYTSG